MKINWMFLFALSLLIVGLFSQAWGFHLAKEEVIENSEYKFIDRETERNFNIWSFERNRNYLFQLTGIVFMILVIYILTLIRNPKLKRGKK